MKDFHYKISKVLTVTLLLGLSACVNRDPRPGEPHFTPAYPEPPAPRVNNGAIYQSQQGVDLFRDRRAHAVGDILTIRLVEQTQAQKKSKTKTKKATVNNIANPTLLGQAFKITDTKNFSFGLQSDSSFDGQGDSDQSNRLAGTISVSVASVQTNGNLVIRGEKWLQLNRGREYVRITGLVRPDDIDDNNEVDSTRVANARIAYTGTGEIADANSMGWLSKFFNGGYGGAMPF